MKSFKQFNNIKDGVIDKNGYPCAVIGFDRKRVLKEQVYRMHQWLDEPDNEDEYKLPSKLHKHQGTTGLEEDNPHHEAINSYTRDSTGTNNRLFREHATGTQSKSHFVDLMDHVTNSHKLPEDLHVYSGVKFNPDELASKHPDRHVHLPAFTSTSIQKEVAQGFANDTTHHEDEHEFTHHHIIHFHLKKGQKGIFVGTNPDHDRDNQLSEHPEEHEFILPRNTKIHIHPEHDTYDDNNESRTYHVHHAHVVDE